MHLHLNNDGFPMEDIRLVGRWACACGAQHRTDQLLGRAAGTTAIGALEHICRFFDRRPCRCGAALGEGSGETVAIHPLVCGAPMLAVVVRHRREVGRLTDRFLTESAEDAIAGRGSVLPAGADDYEIARRAGRPPSLIAAWHDAHMSIRLGAPSAAFPCGPGIACVWAADRQNAERSAADVGVAAHSVHRLTGPAGGIPEWLGDTERGTADMWVAIDPEAVSEQMRAQAENHDLAWERRGGAVALIGPNGHARAFNPDEVTLRALTAGRDPLIEATGLYIAARRAMSPHS